MYRLMLLLGFSVLPAHAADPSIKDLNRLIGTWQFEDRSLPALGFEYLETGTRACAYALDEAYIRCVSTGATKGKLRTYEFHFNYNAIDARFEMVAMFSNYGPKQIYVVSLCDDGRRHDLQVHGLSARGNRTPTKVGPRSCSKAPIGWFGPRAATGPLQHPDEWRAITVDVARRTVPEE